VLARLTMTQGSQTKSRSVLAAGMAVLAMMGTVFAVQPPSAHAEYYWGCTFTTGHPCTALSGGAAINRLWTSDPTAAVGINGYNKPANGYKVPTLGGPERYVCGGAYWAGGMTVPFSCSWGVNEYNLSEFKWGEPQISSSVNYSQIALYQNVNIYE
jgi:hypothetical protein